MSEFPLYRMDISLREQRLPNQMEQRRALERRIGDWFLLKQPRGQIFNATHQRHTRGIWSEDTRKDILKKIRASRTQKPEEREKFLKRLWRENDLVWIRTSLDRLKREVVRAQDLREPVTPVINKHFSKEFPGVARVQSLLDADRLANRGNAHTEIRAVSPAGDVLNGWTLDTPGAMVQFLKSGRLEAAGRDKLQEFGTKIQIPGRERVEVDRIQVQKKSPQPLVWLSLVTKDKPVFESEIGQVGATAATAGRFEFITGGGRPFRRRGAGRSGFSVVYGVRRSNFHEQFHLYEDPKLHERVGGRWTFRLLRLGGRADLPEARRWLARKADDPAPFIFKNDFETEVAQSKKEKTDLFWNHDAVATLEKMGYFKTFDLEKELAEFKESDRGKKPPRGGVARNRPKGKLTKAPEIFGEQRRSNPALLYLTP